MDLEADLSRDLADDLDGNAGGRGDAFGGVGRIGESEGDKGEAPP